MTQDTTERVAVFIVACSIWVLAMFLTYTFFKG